MTDPTLQARYEDALRDCDAQRAELVRLRERVLELEAERDKMRKALGKLSDAAMMNGWMPVPTLPELVALGVRCDNWPEYRAESDRK